MSKNSIYLTFFSYMFLNKRNVYVKYYVLLNCPHSSFYFHPVLGLYETDCLLNSVLYYKTYEIIHRRA